MMAPSLVAGLAGVSMLLAGLSMAVRTSVASNRLALVVGEGAPNHRRLRLEGVLSRVGRTRAAWIVARMGGATLLRERWQLAGGAWSIDALVGLKFLLGLTSTLILATVGLWGGPAPLLAPAAAIASVRAPDFVLARAARRRQTRIATQVVDLVELLVATTEAGLAAPEALRRASEGLSDPLGEELRRVVRQMDLGLPWRLAFEELVRSCDAGSLRRLGATLGRSQRLGTSVRVALEGLLEDLRGERRASAEEMARRAPVKMLFPLILLILPAFLLLTVGPVLLATIRSLESG
jgi:tight adherence protein C